MATADLQTLEDQTVRRFLIQRHGGFFGGSKGQILTIKKQSIELTDATNREENKEIFLLSDIVKIVPVPETKSNFTLTSTKTKDEIKFTCFKRQLLIDSYFKAIDNYLYFDLKEKSALNEFKSYPSKVRLYSDDSEKYIAVTVTIFRTYVCVKRENVIAACDQESSKFTCDTQTLSRH